VLVTGATGFVGSALMAQLARNGVHVVAATRTPAQAKAINGVEWRTCDLLESSTLDAAFTGVRVAYYLVHSMALAGLILASSSDGRRKRSHEPRRAQR